jgi:thiol-disulfide isomerase/thioredoxin
LRTGAIVAAVLVAQGALLLAYRALEQRRKAEQASFRYERVRGAPALDLVLLSPDGSTRRLADLRGRPVLFHFWATWCPPCKDELPGLLDLGRELARKERLQVVALSVDTDWSALQKFFAGRVPPEVFRDSAGSAAARYEVSGLPDTYLIDADGLPRLRFGGARDWRAEIARRTLENELEDMREER